MAYLTMNGHAVVEAHITLPLYGVWFADLVVQDVVPADGVTLVLDDVMALSGTVRRGGGFEDSTHLRVVGGAGGFLDDVKPQHFLDTPLRIPLEQALEDVGELLSPASTEALLRLEMSHWVTRQHAASKVVANLAAAGGGTWRVLGDGRTWVGEETWPGVSVGFLVERARPGSDRATLTLDAPLLLPGYSFQGRNLGDVSYHVTAERICCEVAFVS